MFFNQKKHISTFTALFLGSLLFNLAGQNNFIVRLEAAKENLSTNTDSIYIVLLNLYTEAKNREDTYHKAISSEAFAEAHFKNDEITVAMELYLEALTNYRSTDSILKVAETLLSIAECHKIRNEYDKALVLLLESLEIAENLNNISLLARSCQNIGILHSQMNDETRALHYYNRAHNYIQDKNEFTSLKATILENMGVIYSRNLQHDMAMNNYLKALRIFKQLNEIENQAIIYNNIGVVFDHKKMPDSTLHYYHKALDIFNKIHFKKGMCISMGNIGMILLNNGKPEQALEYLNKSVELAKEINLISALPSNYYDISYVYELRGDFLKALDYLHLAYNYKDTLYSAEKTKKITEIEKLYQSNKKEKEILKLEKIRDKERIFMGGLISALIVLSLFIVFITFHFRVRAKITIEKALIEEQTKRFKAVLEAQEDERKRIAGELHDGIGPLLSVTQLYISDLSDSVSIESPEEQELFARSLKILEEACNETRNISHNLMPGILIRSGLVSAMREIVNKVKIANQYHVNFDSKNINHRFEESIEIANYRIFQELLNNIIKHAYATEIAVTIECVQNKLILHVVDNGKGFNTENLKKSPGVGWKSIYSRLSLINGEMAISSSTQGTNVRITTPLPPL